MSDQDSSVKPYAPPLTTGDIIALPRRLREDMPPPISEDLESVVDT
jgi:hypothetical protein